MSSKRQEMAVNIEFMESQVLETTFGNREIMAAAE